MKTKRIPFKKVLDKELKDAKFRFYFQREQAISRIARMIRDARMKTSLTQAELARRAHMTQPNLSDIERGAQEISLRTLRALAFALDVRPGLLVDGVPPHQIDAPAALDRQALERTAASIAGQHVRLRKHEQEIAGLLGLIMRQRIGALQGRTRANRSKRRSVRAAWMTLRARYPKPVIESLIQRISERAASRT